MSSPASLAPMPVGRHAIALACAMMSMTSDGTEAPGQVSWLADRADVRRLGSAYSGGTAWASHPLPLATRAMSIITAMPNAQWPMQIDVGHFALTIRHFALFGPSSIAL
jgi:hypothetical protein